MEQSLKEKTAKGLLWGGLSNGLQQLLNLIFGIFLGRLLSPDDYGMVGMLTIFSLIAGVLQESGFTMALANKKDASHEDYNAVFWFSAGVSACLYLVLFFCAPFIAEFYKTPELTVLARYSFLGFFIASLGTAHNAYLFRNLMVKQKALAQNTALVISGVTGVTMAFLGFSYWGIATQSLVYVFLVMVCYWHFCPWHPTLSFNLRPLRGLLSFSSKVLVTNIFLHINNNMLTVILGRFYDKRDVGHFTQANKWNYMGHSVVSGMINSVAQPVLSSISDDTDRQRRAFRKMLRFTSFVAFPAMLGLSLIAPELIIIAIGEKWIASAHILRIICVGGAFIPITGLYSNLVVSKGKSNIYMWSTICLGLSQLAAMLLLYPYGVRTMIIVYVAIQIGWLFVWQYFVWREIGLGLFAALKDIVPFAFIALGVMVATYHITLGIQNLYLLMPAKIVIAALLYILIMWGSRSVTFRESMRYIIKKG